MEVKKQLKGDLDYMEIKIKIEYEPTNKIYLTSNEKRTLILSDENKEISAKTILEFLNYKKENRYELEELSEDISNLDENNKNYIEQIHSMLQSIVDGINNIQQ